MKDFVERFLEYFKEASEKNYSRAIMAMDIGALLAAHQAEVEASVMNDMRNCDDD